MSTFAALFGATCNPSSDLAHLVSTHWELRGADTSKEWPRGAEPISHGVTVPDSDVVHMTPCALYVHFMMPLIRAMAQELNEHDLVRVYNVDGEEFEPPASSWAESIILCSGIPVRSTISYNMELGGHAVTLTILVRYP